MQAWIDEVCSVGMTCQVADVTRALNFVSKMCDARYVLPLTGHYQEFVSDEEDVQESEEGTSDDEELDPCVLYGMDDESEIEREARQLREKRNAFQQYMDSFVVHLYSSR